METNKTRIYMGVIIVLGIGFLFALVGWIATNNKLKSYTSVDEFNQMGDSLAVCDDTSTEASKDLCIARLMEFSQLLTKYEQRLQQIKETAQ